MNCFWGANWGFPWFMLIFPVLFLGMMFLMCRRHRGYHWFDGYGCRRGNVEMLSEIAALRKEIEELRKKVG